VEHDVTAWLELMGGAYAAQHATDEAVAGECPRVSEPSDERAGDSEARTTSDDARPGNRVLSVEVDELPTAVVSVRGRELGLKLDTCAAYSIVGANMKRWGTRCEKACS
jgi:hypothetical protein